ncbi:MAG: DUF1080 domain-containing protein [Planctomycetales bacterium]|nr:DUF1080 domain-containing protein [Planctomycetales bacterium]
MKRVARPMTLPFVTLIAAVVLLQSFVAAEQLVLKKGDRLAIVGDSITEQKLYSKFMETYLLACYPELEIQTFQFGWGGERAPGFASRMENDLVPWRPDVVTTCYGMNDGSYREYTEQIGETYEDGMRQIIDRMKKAGATIVVGSPGVVDSFTFARNRPDFDQVYNHNLEQLGQIAKQLATENKFPHADVFGAMNQAMLTAKSALGEEFPVAGGDGVHPGPNGHLVMAYAFLKSLGLDGDLGIVTIDLAANSATATGGHRILGVQSGEFELESSRYPFCFYGGENDQNGTASILPFISFNQDLNRFVLKVTGLSTSHAEVTFGSASKTFSKQRLAQGINLAAEFIDNPFVEPFNRVLNAVGEKQAAETTMIKGFITNFRQLSGPLAEDSEVQSALQTIRRKMMEINDVAHAKAKAAVKPVKYSIAIKPTNSPPAEKADGGEFVDLFNGEDLTGWTQRNGTATYRIEGDTIVGKTSDGSPNSFLCTDKLYGDFELNFEVKVDPQLNSGVQIRSQSVGDTPEGRVNGPQVEISLDGLAGYVYGEAAGGWMTPDTDRKPHQHFNDGQWNVYRVVAVGNKIQTWINGHQISDLTHDERFKSHPKGFIGLQVHGIGQGQGPYEVRWRNLKLRDLTNAGATSDNTLSDDEKQSGWRLLFDGQSTAGWRGYKSQTIPASWRVENGSLLSRREQGRSTGDIITDEQFDNFELRLDWKMTQGNNSGVIYRATQEHDQVWQSGPEYQILDNTTHLDGLNTLASAGACYAVFAPAKDATKTLGQWNQTRILAQGKHVEHWLNGDQVVEYNIDSNRWKAHVKTSKFFATAYGQGNWGQAPKGHIGLQDYGGAIEFRNIMIRPLPATAE